MAFFDASNPNLYIAIALSVVNGVMLCFCGYKFSFGKQIHFN